MRSPTSALTRSSTVVLFSILFVSACSSSGSSDAPTVIVSQGGNGQIAAEGSNIAAGSDAAGGSNQTNNNQVNQQASDAGMSANSDGGLSDNTTNGNEGAGQSGPDHVVPDPLVESTTRITFNITVPAYQSNALQLSLNWDNKDVNANWVGDELWSVSDEFPTDTEIPVTITFYDNNGAITLATIERAISTSTNPSQIVEFQAGDFDSSLWDDDGDGISNLDELISGTYGIDTSRVLLFSETRDFRHDSTETAVAALEELANADGILTDTAGDSAGVFTDTNLSNYDAVVWVLTSGDVLNTDEQAAFERYIQSGGGYAGIHAASFTEYEWPWYGELVGAYFDSHPDVQSATQDVEDGTHPSTTHLGLRWTRTDEWYDYRTNPRSRVNVLLTLDEDSYTGGTMGADHPSAWYHEYDGGRSWYTGGGHTEASYSEPDFRTHLLGGIRYAAEHKMQ